MGPYHETPLRVLDIPSHTMSFLLTQGRFIALFTRPVGVKNQTARVTNSWNEMPQETNISGSDDS